MSKQKNNIEAQTEQLPIDEAEGNGQNQQKKSALKKALSLRIPPIVAWLIVGTLAIASFVTMMVLILG